MLSLNRLTFDQVCINHKIQLLNNTKQRFLHVKNNVYASSAKCPTVQALLNYRVSNTIL